MKSNLLTISSILAAASAFVILPVSAAAAGITFTVAGILAVFVADYSRDIRPLSLPAEIVPFNPAGRMSAVYGKAA
jgi:hypothetical protein